MKVLPHIIGRGAIYVLLYGLALNISCLSADAADKHLRVNQVGYLPADTKVAIVSTNDNLSGWTFSIVKVSDGSVAFGPASVGNDQGSYCAFSHNYRLDFSAFTTSGNYRMRLSDGDTESLPFTIDDHVYAALHEEVLKFLRAQRSGYNPFIPATCHATGAPTNHDAKGVDDGQVYDISGGWYDAGDYIKFLQTSSNVLDLLLFTYKENKVKFADYYMADGTSGSNGIPDILDEAKYGLDWVLKLHTSSSKLYYQNGDSRDHSAWRLPQNDTTNYDLGGYRPAYHGIGANIAGRSAAALAMASKIWEEDLGDAAYAATCLTAAEELYSLAKDNLKVQGGTNGYYTESSYYDDLELAAIELYKATGTASYLTEATNYSFDAGSSWGWFDWGGINALAHYELYPHVSAVNQKKLKKFLQDDLNENLSDALSNPFRVSTDYGWGSASVMTGTVVMCDLYKKLFPTETTYDALHDEVRDYILGKNQWGVSWVIGLGDNYTQYPHHQVADITGREIAGTCIEGPMSQSEWNGMGITLSGPDEYAEFQSSTAIYHDDVRDWATNEPTIFQASLTLCALAHISSSDIDRDGLTYEEETLYGSNPYVADSDGDGIADGDEIDWNVDSDSDGLINAMDTDSDNDGYTDYMESFYGTSPLNSGEYPSTLRINFQPAAAAAPGSYLTDTGAIFTPPRAYGW